jgi:hypothetical protein
LSWVLYLGSERSAGGVGETGLVQGVSLQMKMNGSDTWWQQ